MSSVFSSSEPAQTNKFVEINPTYRPSTVNNPMMNVPITDYDTVQKYDNYNHYMSNTDPSKLNVRSQMETNLINKLFQDPADKLFERNNSQRQWYSVANGSVPNDQTAFAESLFGREYVCKSGSIWDRYGLAYTDDSLACTGFEGDGQTTNFNSINRNQTGI